MCLTVPILVLGVDEARHHPVPSRGMDRVKPLSPVTIRVVVEDLPGDLVTRVKVVSALGKGIC